MATWGDFAAARPDLAEAGRAEFYRVGVGLAFLATVRRDGGPRLHPMCPLMDGRGLYAFIIPSPKRGDLARDGRYSMHSYPRPDDEDAFMVAGRARRADDDPQRDALVAQYVAERAAFGFTEEALAGQQLFAFDIERCLLTRTTGHGDPDPQHTVWHST